MCCAQKLQLPRDPAPAVTSLSPQPRPPCYQPPWLCVYPYRRFPRELPESLRPRQGPVTPMQLRVYEDFARIPRTAPPVPPVTGPGVL